LRGATSDPVEFSRSVVWVDEREQTHIGRTCNTTLVEVTEIIHSINRTKEVITNEPVAARVVNKA
jgi:hypothetical protein